MSGKQQTSQKKSGASKTAKALKKAKNVSKLYSAPAAQGRVNTTQRPMVSGSPYVGDGSTRIRHREFLADISGSVAFAVTSFSINPGLTSTFPWCAKYPARGYESYLADNIRFCYESEKSSNTDGSVMLAVDFDASDAAPPNKTQLMAYHNAVRSNVWLECCYEASKADLQKFGVQRYVRSGAVPSGTDIKTYDVGTLFIATQGCVDTSKIGELYIEYDVQLHTPQLDFSDSASADSVNLTGAVSVSDSSYLGTTPTYVGGLLQSSTGNTITFNQVGQFLVEANVVGTGFGANPTQTGTATVVAGVSCVNATGTLSVQSYIVTVNNRGETLILDYSGATTVTASTVRIGSYAAANA